jgi:hypothetical protein
MSIQGDTRRHLPKFKPYDIVRAVDSLTIADPDEIALYPFAESVIETWQPPEDTDYVPKGTLLGVIDPAWDSDIQDFVYLLQELADDGHSTIDPNAELFIIAEAEQLVLHEACDQRTSLKNQMRYADPTNADGGEGWTLDIMLLDDQSPLMYNVMPLFPDEDRLDAAVFINGLYGHDNLVLEIALNFGSDGNVQLYTSVPVDLAIDQETRTVTVYLDNKIHIDYDKHLWKSKRLTTSGNSSSISRGKRTPDLAQCRQDQRRLSSARFLNFGRLGTDGKLNFRRNKCHGSLFTRRTTSQNDQPFSAPAPK